MNTISQHLPRTFDIIQQGIAACWHLGVQMFVSVTGQTIVDDAVGEVKLGESLTNSHLMWWLSSGKPLTAVAVLMLVDRGAIALDDRVSHYMPEFAQNGKESITLRHLLTHTAGLQPVPTGWPRASWDDSIDRICRAKIRQGGIAGESPGYDPARTWFLLGEVIRQIDGRTVDTFVREELCEPLGISDCWMAMTPERHAHFRNRIAPMYVREVSRETESGAGRPTLRMTEDHAEAVCTRPAPGGSLRGPVRELGRFYQMLLQEGTHNGVQFLRPQTVQLMTSRQRRGQFDTTFQHIVDFGLGVLVDSNEYGSETVPYGFGRHCSASTFGHGGAESSIGFCDPVHQLVVAWASNGRPGESTHQVRNREINSAIYEDLTFVTKSGEQQ